MKKIVRNLSVRALPLAACSVALLALAGCGQVNGTASTRLAQLRIVDASPDAGSVDVYLNSTAAAYNLNFGSVSSYFPVAPSTYTLSANTAGTKTVLTSLRAPLAVNTQYTLLIGGPAAGLQSTLLTDQSQSAAGGQVSFRFVDQATRTGAVDVYYVPAGGTVAASMPVITGITFNQVRGYISVPAGSYFLAVLPAGTVPTSATIPLFSGSQTNFPGSSARTVLLLDGQLAAAPALQAVVLNDYDSPNSTM